MARKLRGQPGKDVPEGILVSVGCHQVVVGAMPERATEDARRLLRKWDNVKHASEVPTERARPRKAYENPVGEAEKDLEGRCGRQRLDPIRPADRPRRWPKGA